MQTVFVSPCSLTKVSCSLCRVIVFSQLSNLASWRTRDWRMCTKDRCEKETGPLALSSRCYQLTWSWGNAKQAVFDKRLQTTATFNLLKSALLVSPLQTDDCIETCWEPKRVQWSVKKVTWLETVRIAKWQEWAKWSKWQRQSREPCYSMCPVLSCRRKWSSKETAWISGSATHDRCW